MEILAFVLIAIVSCTAGAAASWLINDSRRARQLDGVEADMIAQVRQRYEAYVRLEARITRALQRFDIREADFQRRLHNQKHCIEELKSALDTHESFAAHASDTAFLGLPQLGDEPVAASTQSVEEPAAVPFADALAQMDAWEERAVSDLEQKNLEIELQSTQITDLTDQVKRLEPLSRTVYQREQEIEAWRRKYSELEAALTLQASALDECVQELRPVATELCDNEEAVRTMRTRFEERLAAREAEAETLVQRVRQLGQEERRAVELAARNGELETELQGRRGEALVLEQRYAKLERDAEEMRRELQRRIAVLEPVVDEAGELRRAVAGLREEIAEKDEAVQLLTRSAAERVSEYEARIADDEVLLAELRLHSADAEERLAEARRRAEEAERRIEVLQGRAREAEARAREHEVLAEQHQGLVAEREALIAEHEGQLAEQSARAAECEERLAEARALIDQGAQRAADNEARLAEARRRAADGDERIEEAMRELSETRARASGIEERRAALEREAQATIDDLRKELDLAAAKHGELSAVHEGLVRRLDGQGEALELRQRELDVREERIRELSGRVEELGRSLESTRETQASKICELMRELDDVTNEAQTRSSTLSQAHSLLESLRPVIETLETTLQGAAKRGR